MNAETEIAQLKEEVAKLSGELAALKRGPARVQAYQERQNPTIRSAPAPQVRQAKLRSNLAAPTIIRSEQEPRIVHQTEEGEIEI